MGRSLSRKVRFEVFKRDKFTCQYCGRSAPEVVLQVDHIQPVIEGGSDDVLNLVTSCQPCNAGKGARLLDDDSVIAKSRLQVAELQERREQLEMMIQWRDGLRGIEDQAVDSLADHWERLAPGWSVNANGKRGLRKHSRKFGVQEVIEAMEIAAEVYLVFTADGLATRDSWEEAFSKIGGICHNRRHDESYESLKDLLYIRGIAKRRFKIRHPADMRWMLDFLKSARDAGVNIESVRRLSLQCDDWDSFVDAVSELCEEEGS